MATAYVWEPDFVMAFMGMGTSESWFSGEWICCEMELRCGMRMARYLGGERCMVEQYSSCHQFTLCICFVAASKVKVAVCFFLCGLERVASSMLRHAIIHCIARAGTQASQSRHR